MPVKNSTIIVGITGGISAYKACDIVNELAKKGIQVEVIMTECAQHFVPALVMQTLSHHPVHKDMFACPSDWNVSHISLAQKADLIAVVPTTAQFLSKIASGICDDLLSCTIISTKAPVLFAPAMNEQMYKHPIIQANISTLKDVGYHFVGPTYGRLACGQEGLGHLEDTGVIVHSILSFLDSRTKKT